MYTYIEHNMNRTGFCICKDTLVPHSIQVQISGSAEYVTCCFVDDLLYMQSTIDPKLKWEGMNAYIMKAIHLFQEDEPDKWVYVQCI